MSELRTLPTFAPADPTAALGPKLQLVELHIRCVCKNRRARGEQITGEDEASSPASGQ